MSLAERAFIASNQLRDEKTVERLRKEDERARKVKEAIDNRKDQAREFALTALHIPESEVEVEWLWIGDDHHAEAVYQVDQRGYAVIVDEDSDLVIRVARDSYADTQVSVLDFCDRCGMWFTRGTMTVSRYAGRTDSSDKALGNLGELLRSKSRLQGHECPM